MGCRGVSSRVVDSQAPVPHRCAGIPPETRILSCWEAIQLACGMAVVQLGCSVVIEIMHGGKTKVFY